MSYNGYPPNGGGGGVWWGGGGGGGAGGGGWGVSWRGCTLKGVRRGSSIHDYGEGTVKKRNCLARILLIGSDRGGGVLGSQYGLGWGGNSLGTMGGKALSKTRGEEGRKFLIDQSDFQKPRL